MNGLKDAFRALRKENAAVDELLELINRDRRVPFTEAEADVVLSDLERQNRIMYRDRQVFLI